MRSVMLGWALMLGVSGCGGAQNNGDQPASAETASAEAPIEQDGVTQDPMVAEGDSKPEGEETSAPAAGGRMAFTQCTDPRAEMCTKEYRPVCGVVDNGVRCIAAPCPSTEQRNFGNACMACAEPKTQGYWPVACEQLGNDAH